MLRGFRRLVIEMRSRMAFLQSDRRHVIIEDVLPVFLTTWVSVLNPT